MTDHRKKADFAECMRELVDIYFPHAEVIRDVFAQTLRSRNVNFAYLIYPTGEHDAAYWQSHLDEYMAFYGQGWSHDSTELPTCT